MSDEKPSPHLPPASAQDPAHSHVEKREGTSLEKVAVIGAGSWGTTVAAMASKKAPTVLWARREELAGQVNESHMNEEYLPGIPLPEELAATACLEKAVEGVSLLVMAVPSHGMRQVARELSGSIAPGALVVSLAKGLEQGSCQRMTQVLADVLPGHAVGVVSGPNLAREIASGHPAATVVASQDEVLASEVQWLLHSERMRIYTNPDVVGCEIAGATKNVLALAAGMSVGLGLGDSSLAALVTRGLAELGRLVVALGGEVLTVASLAGVGDLIATCTSPLSRNRGVGEALGRGRSIEEVVGSMRMVAEGVKTARPLVQLAHELGVEMPICEQVARVVEGASTPAESLGLLMTRSPRSEF